MTTEQLIDGVVGAISEEFGTDYPIRTENNEQGFNGPCFYVKCIRPTQNRFFWRRFLRTWQMAVYYFPAERILAGDYEPNTERNEVAERLFECLEMFPVGDARVMTTGKEATESDGALVMTFNVEMYVTKADNTELMRTQTTNLEAE